MQSNETDQTTFRPATEIEPMVPLLPNTETSTDRPTRRRPERPPQTDYATSYTRDTEEIMPGVPDLR